MATLHLDAREQKLLFKYALRTASVEASHLRSLANLVYNDRRPSSDLTQISLAFNKLEADVRTIVNLATDHCSPGDVGKEVGRTVAQMLAAEKAITQAQGEKLDAAS